MESCTSGPGRSKREENSVSTRSRLRTTWQLDFSIGSGAEAVVLLVRSKTTSTVDLVPKFSTQAGSTTVIELVKSLMATLFK